jgi:hypothetical protein
MHVSTKRDNAYYLERIRFDHPAVYADYAAHIHKTVTAARRAAGMIAIRTPLHELKRAWGTATERQRREFASWTGWPTTMPATVRPPTKVLHRDGVLLPWAIARIRKVMLARRLRMGAVMTEMGFKALDASLGNALHGTTRVRTEVIVALGRWLKSNRSIA